MKVHISSKYILQLLFSFSPALLIPVHLAEWTGLMFLYFIWKSFIWELS